MAHSTPSSADIRVVGEVGAGYLKSKSAVSYSSLIGTDLTRLTDTSRNVEFQHAAQRVTEFPTMVQSISADEVTKHWSTFVSNVSKSHIAIGMSLTETKVLDVHNGMVRISCPDDYHFSTLKRNREFLASALHQVAGKRVAIEPVLRSNTDVPIKAVYTPSLLSTDTKVSEPVQNPSQTKEHPILTLLKRELGAERIE